MIAHRKAADQVSFNDTLYALILTLVLASLSSCSQPPSGHPSRHYHTYCNPIDIDYTYSVVNTDKHNSYRS